MRPPIILVEGQDINFFSSANALESYLESPDIACYRVFDADGRRLRLTTDVPPPEGSRRVGLVAIGRVKVSLWDPPEAAPAELAKILSDFLKTLTGQPGMATDLGELIREVAKQIGVDD